MLAQRLHRMRGLDLVGKATLGGKTIELTKLIIYDLKDAKRNNINVLMEDERTLEDMRIANAQVLAATEVLTDEAK